jgi:hypothetical protein
LPAQADYALWVDDHVVALALGGTNKARLTKIFHDPAEGGQTKMPPPSSRG